MTQPPRPSRRKSRAAPVSPANEDLASFEPPEFEPAYPRPRFDGWTAERQASFIQALGESGCVAEACRSVGMSERSAYSLRARADAVSFRNAWDAALDYAIRRLSDRALSRALNGVTLPVFYQGEQIGERRYFDERLAMFLLRYRDPLRYGKWLDRQDHLGHPEGSALDLFAAKRAVREDAGLGTEETPDRVELRLDEIAERIAAKARAVRFAGDAPEGETDGNVP
jgi:hypothetical protein